MTHDAPFAPHFSRPSFLVTPGVGEALRRLEDGLGVREPFLLVTGESGTGKSALVNEAIARWGGRVRAAHLALPLGDGTELIEEILRRLDVRPPEGANRPALVACLEDACAEIAGRGEVAMIVVDDAHHLTPALLEELRLLANASQQSRRPLEVLLVGLPALEATLDHPALAALRQRVSVRARMAPLSAGETRRYVRHRLAAAGDDRPNLFPRKTCAEIAALSCGVPRQINLIAAGALRLARDAGQPTVEPGHVRDAVAALSGLLPAGGPADAADVESEAVPVAAPARTPEPRTPAAARDARVDAPPPAAAPAPRVAPAGPSAETAAPAVAAARRTEDPPTARFEPPAPSDPREWVARFIGDKGPIRISSQANVPASLDFEDFEPDDAAVEEPARTSRAGDGGSAGPIAPSRPRRVVNLRVVLGAAFAALVAAAVLWWGMRAIGRSRSTVATSAAATTVAGAAPSGAKEPPPRAAESASPPAAEPAPRRVVAATPPAAAALPRGPYTLDAGVRLEYWAALDERDRLQALTGIEGWVAPASGAEDGKYRVVLGIFRKHARAEAAAQMLTRSRTLADVEVVSLPPRSLRQ